MGEGFVLSKLGILVAQLESIVHSGSVKPLQPLLCFDLLSDLLSTLDQESKESLLPYQRKGEDALQALLLLGVRPPVRRLASVSMTRFIQMGDSISIYSRASSLQGWLGDKADLRKSEPAACIGAAQCLGSLYQAFGARITSGLLETSNIVMKLMKSSEVRVRQAALQLLKDALEGSNGGGPLAAYVEAVRIILRTGASDKSSLVRATAAACLRAVAVTGGPGVGSGGLEACIFFCLKALEDNAQAVRDGFAAALGALLALGLNPNAQVQPKGKGPPVPPKHLEGALQKHLVSPFLRASGSRCKDVRVGLTMAWVAFLQRMHLSYGHNNVELSSLGMEAISMLTSSTDAHAQACVLYILRVGVVEQMGEPAQKEFTLLLTRELFGSDNSSPRLVVILRTVAHLLITLGEVSLACREALDDSLVQTLSNSSMAVRVEAALTLRALSEVDPACANNLLSCGVTSLRALRETLVVEKGDRLRLALDSLHGQAAMLAALLAVCPKLPLGVPYRLPSTILDVAKAMVFQPTRNSISRVCEKEAGWMLIGALVTSMPKQELEEQELEIIALWTIEFGNNYQEQLKQAENNLAAHLSGWTAAMEALTAFVKSYVVPNLMQSDGAILLQPILGYLTGALRYLASSTLQQAPQSLKPSVDLFTIRTLRAFQTIPDPYIYRHDHVELLAICSLPFREPEKYVASSCLRELLDHRDASLGPWVPGRDNFEDELRAFEGGADGLLLCVWDYEVPAFSQPLSLATVLVDDMLLCFGNIFATQSERNKLQLLELMANKISGRKQVWRTAFMSNVCVALLGGLKGILAEEGTSSAELRAAAEGLGVLARVGGDVYAARLARSLIANAVTAQNAVHKGSLALALGCIHRSVGGMALSTLVPSTVQAMCGLARDPTDLRHIWVLHGLWLTAEAAGLSYVPYVQATLSLVMDLLLSDDHASPELGQITGRLVNAIVAVLGPELSPGSSLFSRCKTVVSEISTGEEPATLLECVMFTQQLALFAPQAVSVHLHVQTLRPSLSSRQPTLRQAAVATLRHLSERDPVSLVVEQIEEDLFAMLDNETDERIVKSVRQTLERLLEAACPSFPSRWLHLCRNVVLATSSTKTAGAGYQGGDMASGSHEELGHQDEVAKGEDIEGMIVSSGMGPPSGKSESKGKDNHMPRYKTRLFAAECLSRLPIAVGTEPTHFDFMRAKEQKSGDWLVLHLGELVALAYQVATGILESVRPKGVELLDVILDKFGKTEDPEFEGHLLLEQYQAQLVSAVRTALEPSAGPLLMAAGSRLAARIVTSGVAGGDHEVLQRIFALISRPLLKWEDLRIPSYAEWVSCKVQVSLLGAHAAVKTYAFACSKEGSSHAPDGLVLLPLLLPYSSFLAGCWVGLLKDYTAICTQWATKMQPRYEPFLDGVQLAAIATLVLPLLTEAWPVVLEAVTVDAVPEVSEDSKVKANGNTGTGRHFVINASEYKQLWALAMLILMDTENQGAVLKRSSTSFPSSNGQLLIGDPTSNLQLVALNALRCLCAKGFYSSDMLSRDLCEELLQVLLDPSFKRYYWAPAAIVHIVDQIINCCTEVYLEEMSLVLKLVELCFGSMHRLQEGALDDPWSSEVDGVVCCALRAMGTLVDHLNDECQSLLIPQLLAAGFKVLSGAPAKGNAGSAAVDFITAVCLTTAKSDGTSSSIEFGLDKRASLLASAVETLAQLVEGYLSEASESEDNGHTQHLTLLLGVMVAMARSVQETLSPKQAMQARCIACLHSSLSSRYAAVQLAGLQTLRTVAQAGLVEQPRGEIYAWALFILHRLTTDVISIVYNATKASMTALSAGAVGEGLKLLVLLHSMVEGEEAQLDVMHVLLPVIIAAASVNVRDNQAVAAMANAAVKLVTHLALVPSSAAQFRKVLLDLPPESRQQLQGIIRASMLQQDSASSGLPTPAVLQPAFTNLVLPPPPTGILPPPPTSAHFSMRSASLPSQVSHNFEDEDEDDEWDDFQANDAPGSFAQPESAVEDETVEFQENFLNPSTSASTDPVEVEEEEKGVLSELPLTINTPAQQTIKEYEGSSISSDTLPETSQRWDAKDEHFHDTHTVSTLSNPTVSETASRIYGTSQPEDEDMWDSFESATGSQKPDVGDSQDFFGDDDIWDSSLPGDIVHNQKSNSRSQTGLKEISFDGGMHEHVMRDANRNEIMESVTERDEPHRQVDDDAVEAWEEMGKSDRDNDFEDAAEVFDDKVEPEGGKEFSNFEEADSKMAFKANPEVAMTLTPENPTDVESQVNDHRVDEDLDDGKA
ncbi:hypothetical protein CY35_04G109200 [Sphagnum magellanicum]|nr:hypothetical protein CY35_04G109200 [Sphagnum magellanicum]